MRNLKKIFVAVLLAFAFTGMTAYAAPATDTIDAKGVLDAVNAEREEAGLVPLTWNEKMVSGTSVRAMEASTLWSHTRPDGTEYWTADEANIFGENLAMGFDSNVEVISAWMNSKSHKANCLDSEFTSACVAVYITETNTTYVAMEFGY